ncbi:MAG: AAA family ATPase [Parcubacteria group bacterium]|jgi:hypothetical protein
MPITQSQTFYVKKIYLKNFKKFSNAEIDFGAGLNFLIGPNNAGKSTILQAVDIVVGDTWLSEDMLDHSFFYEEENNFVVCVEIAFPNIGCSSNRNRINFIRNLKLAKGNVRSMVYGQFSNATPREFLDGDEIDSITDVVGEDINIESVHFFTVAKREDGSLSVENFVVLNLCEPVYKNDGNYTSIQISLTKWVRSNLISFLFIPAARSENRQIFQVAQHTWLGKYLKILQKEKNSEVESYFDQCHLQSFPLEFDNSVKDILKDLFGDISELSLHTFDHEHCDSLYKYAHVFLSDPFLAEIDKKGHGIQSASAIALFLGFLEREALNHPEYSTSRSGSAPSHWATILQIEEPESHFHPPARIKLVSILKQKFADSGAQVIVSTHDEGFVKWPFMNGSNLIFPGAIDPDGKIKSILFHDGSTDSTMEINSRILRFQASTIFSQRVLIVEGCEAVCLNAIFMRLLNEDLESNAITMAQSVSSQPRTDHGDSGNLQPAGGASQIPDTVQLYKQLGIKSACLIDIDCLFNGSIGRIIESFGGVPRAFIFDEVLTQEEVRGGSGMVSAQDMRSIIAASPDKERRFSDLVERLSNIGIFVYNKGDFEGNFTDRFVNNYISRNNKIIKEALCYAIKSKAEMSNTFDVDCLQSNARQDLEQALACIKAFFSTD